MAGKQKHECPNCGAPLTAAEARAETCRYCEADLHEDKPARIEVVRELRTREIVREVPRGDRRPPRSDRKGIPWLVQLAFAVAAGFVVYGFVDMAKHAEERRACDSLVQLRPRYLGYDRSAPDFELPDGKGGTVKLSSYRGKVVILHFWTKTCGPCLEELPLVAEFADKVKDRHDVAVLAVTIDQGPADIADTMKTLFGDKVPAFTLAFDAENAVVRDKYGTRLFPETWLVDPSGIIRARFDGIPFAGEGCDVAWKSPLLLSAIDALEAPAVCDLVVDPKVDPRPDKLLAACRR